ncbi:MAG TPA: 50S ribosomal protein L21 [Planctomycetota bacterium]|nr:50S ribosomal protein L21 [Planctomycetota bacterium]
MYAIIKDGGHQYRVENGRRLRIQLRDGAEKDGVVRFDQVCLIGGAGDAKVGAPFVAGASVEAKVIEPLRKAKKVIIFKYRRRKNSQRRNGHRQKFTEVEITAING